ncbi:hypothetical protein [Pararhizobium sp. DWP1-1-3]|uniref:hypothetical protein n=1 Tax=Pararhizobium sp. DWP1-1-3 TaxID=2804652 RepID=UPI003CEF48C4
MMQRGSNRMGKRNRSTGGNELEEYFAELGDGETDNYGSQLSPRGTSSSGLSVPEEIRRLTAYVAHLDGIISSRLGSQQVALPRAMSGFLGPAVGLVIAISIAVALRAAARR